MNTLQEKYSRTNYPDKLEEFYQGNVPEYILDADNSFIKIRVSDWRGEQDLRITPRNVVEYYYRWARNITSGCRVIAGYAGDWRPIDRLVKECLEWFLFVNIGELKISERSGK